jgi:hypothetical protein
VVGLKPTTLEVEARSSIPLSYTPNIYFGTPGGSRTHNKQILSLPPLPIGLQEQDLAAPPGLVACFPFAESPEGKGTWNLRFQRARCCQLHHRALLPGQGLNLQPHRSERCDLPIRPPGNEINSCLNRTLRREAASHRVSTTSQLTAACSAIEL